MIQDPGDTIDKPSELKIALDNRAFEIQLFWQRSNYFLVLITALAVGVFTIKDTWLALIIALFASLSSFFWYKTNLGSKFWQESWEVEVTELAMRESIKSFERSISDIVEQVEKQLSSSMNGKSRLQKYIDRKVVTKPSVSYYMTLLSLWSTLLWGVISIYYAFAWLESIDIKSLLRNACAAVL